MNTMDGFLARRRQSSDTRTMYTLAYNIFVHFEELFCINESSGLIRVSFGANERNEKAYIWVQEDGKASYLPDAILATKSNSAAHTLMKEWFHGICD